MRGSGPKGPLSGVPPPKKNKTKTKTKTHESGYGPVRYCSANRRNNSNKQSSLNKNSDHANKDSKTVRDFPYGKEVTKSIQILLLVTQHHHTHYTFVAPKDPTEKLDRAGAVYG